MNAFTSSLAMVDHATRAPSPCLPVTPSPVTPSLSSRAILVVLNVSFWEGKKLDKRTTREVHEEKEAKSGAGNFNKHLIQKSDLDPMIAARSDIRSTYEHFTQPWGARGVNILAAALIPEFDARMRNKFAAFYHEVDLFCDRYDDIRARAMVHLGKLFDPLDYPTVDIVRNKFSANVRKFILPDTQDFRLNVSDAQARELRAEIERESAAIASAAMRDPYERIAKLTKHMVDKLTTYKPAMAKGEKTEGKLYDSMVENIRELVAVLPAFNLTDDAGLADITERMRALLCANDTETLKGDATLRDATARAAQAILDDVSAFLA